MGVNLGSIVDKLNKYASSKAGKAKMDAAIQSIREGGNASLGSRALGTNTGVATYHQMEAAAEDLIAIIRRHAASSNLPESVMAHIESFCKTPLIKNPDGSASISLTMTDDLSRESLQPDKFDGSYNIVAAFNSGYSAKGSVYGLWKSKDIKVKSLSVREGSRFIQSAVDEFNSKYAAKYNVTVSIDSVYN